MFNWLGDRQFSREYIDFLRIVYHQMVRKGPFHCIFGEMRLPQGFRVPLAISQHGCDFHPYALDFVSL
jgi:hypothetical protein